MPGVPGTRSCALKCLLTRLAAGNGSGMMPGYHGGGMHPSVGMNPMHGNISNNPVTVSSIQEQQTLLQNRVSEIDDEKVLAYILNRCMVLSTL